MNQGRLIGIVVTVIGFVVAVVAGLWIASQAASGLSSSGALLGAGVAFVPVALLVGFGIYMYTRNGSEPEVQSEMEQQRLLLDIIGARGQMSMDALASEMNVTDAVIRGHLDQLVSLQVFSGYINWETGLVGAASAESLRVLDRCLVCSSPLSLKSTSGAQCSACKTDYFLS